jgi:hypothetical protein
LLPGASYRHRIHSAGLKPTARWGKKAGPIGGTALRGRFPGGLNFFFDSTTMRPKALSFFRLDPPVRHVLALLPVWLVIVNLFALMALNRLNIVPDTALAWMSPETYRVHQSWNVISLHNRWDSYWYLDIAQNGYYLRGPESLANVVFFPLYPLLVRAMGSLVGGDLVLAGWIVSSVFLALSIFMLTRLTQEFHPELDPKLPAVFLLVYPTAFFLNAVYTESLFLFLSLAVVYCTLKRNFLLAGIWSAFASATRMPGLFLCLLVLIEFIQAYGWRGLFSRRVWPLALAPLGTLAFFLYLWAAFGDFFIFLKVESAFGRGFELGSSFFKFRNNPDVIHTLLDFSYTVAMIVFSLIAMRRLRLSYGAYMLVSVGIVLLSGTALGIARYGMVMFPIYLIAAGIRSAVGRSAWIFGSTLLLALNITRFVYHYWAG